MAHDALDQAMQMAKLGHWESDQRTGRSVWSDQLYRNLGYEPGEVEASVHAYLARVHPLDRRMVDAIVARLREGEGSEYEHRLLLPDGSIRWCRVHTTVDRSPSGETLRVFGAIQDITASRSAEDNATWFAALVESADEVIFSADTAGEILTWNSGAASFYGYTEEEVLGRPLAMLRAPETLDHLSDVITRLNLGGTVDPYETLHVRKDGSTVDVMVTVSAVRRPDGQVLGSSAMVRDISSAKRAQEELEQERTMVEKLRDLDRVRTSFVSSVSHELRTPLTSILGYLEILMDDMSGMDEHQQDMLGIVRRNSGRLLALIEDLLVLSRIESGSFKVLKEPVDIRALVAAVAREIKPRADAGGHKLSASVADGVGAILGDPGELERLLKSLLSNAIKFTPKGGSLSIHADATSDGTRIVVRDTGTGIPAKELPEIFDPFFRSSDAERRAIPGTGLGLSIAKTIVEQHGGTIECVSTVGEGTTVTVVLPFAIPDRRAS